jgi:hypothetical protein
MSRMPRRLAPIVLIPIVTAFLAPLALAQSPSPQDLARLWDAEHVSPPVPPLMDHADVERRLKALASDRRFVVEQVGESVEGRSINLVTLGHGPFRVMLWSQMHGDEPTATAAIFDIFEYFQRHAEDPSVRRMTNALTLYFVPMLNPDGAERFQRRNAQGIDINRDALRLQTPEGRLLKELRARFNPKLGFNLHNQNWRTSVGDPPKPASISLLSVAFDKAGSDSPGRRLTRKVCAVIRDALEPFASGQIGRYDDAFEVRAFGDNLTLWGTPVVLIETGPWPSAEPDPGLVRLNFIGILSALDAVATGSVERADPKRYTQLPMNQSREFYVLVKNATIHAGTGVEPFQADIGINATRGVQIVNGDRAIRLRATINDLGDLRTSGGLRVIDATGLAAAPLFDASLKRGQTVALPDWTEQAPAHTIAPGEPADIVLLRPAPETGRYIVDTVLRY